MSEIDSIIHQPVRLRIMASLMALDPGDKTDFVFLRKLLNVTDGNLGAHLLRLEGAGYVKIEKVFVARRPRTYVSPTAKGRAAFDEHVAALNKIIRK